jgi:hypothetical protein
VPPVVLPVVDVVTVPRVVDVVTVPRVVDVVTVPRVVDVVTVPRVVDVVTVPPVVGGLHTHGPPADPEQLPEPPPGGVHELPGDLPIQVLSELPLQTPPVVVVVPVVVPVVVLAVVPVVVLAVVPVVPVVVVDVDDAGPQHTWLTFEHDPLALCLPSLEQLGALIHVPLQVFPVVVDAEESSGPTPSCKRSPIITATMARIRVNMPIMMIATRRELPSMF